MKKTVILILVGFVIFSGMYIGFKRDFEQFNPFYKQEEVYVVVDTPGKPGVRRNNAVYCSFSPDGMHRTVMLFLEGRCEG